MEQDDSYLRQIKNWIASSEFKWEALFTNICEKDSRKIFPKFGDGFRVISAMMINYMKRNCLCYFGLGYIFFGERAGCNLGKLSSFAVRTFSCSIEHSFSIMGRPKTNLRSTMGQDPLSHLALLCNERAHVNTTK